MKISFFKNFFRAVSLIALLIPLTVSAAAPTYKITSPDPAIKIPIDPLELNTPIAGLKFSTNLETKNGLMQVPFIAQYISAVYRYLMGVAVIAAAIMITYGGFLYITSSSIHGITDGKEYIVNAIIGLIILFGSYAILYTINPAVLNLKSISVKAVTEEDFQFMENGPGFSVADPATQQALATTQASTETTGAAPALTPQDVRAEGGVSTARVTETGTRPSQKISAYCTSPDARSSLTDYDSKITALVRAVLGFRKICINENSCAYVRTGFTAIPQGSVGSGIKDFPFLFRFWNDKAKSAPFSADCLGNWNGLMKSDGTNGYYANFSTHEKTEFLPYYKGGGCYEQLNDDYKTYLTESMTKQGLIGGDCGSMLAQIYKCAGGSGGRPFSGDATSLFYYINYYSVSQNPAGQSPGPDFPVWRATDIDNYREQIAKVGGPKFGDIFVIGQFGKGQHNFMYTGGRNDVDFDIFEMGGGGNLDGTIGAKMTIHGPKGDFEMRGMHTVPLGSLELYLESYGKGDCSVLKSAVQRKFCESQKGTAWPVTVARPYAYNACHTRSDCGNDEVCLCTQLDGKKLGQGQYEYKENCGAKFICRKPVSKTFMNSFSMLCQNDEMCPNGWGCPNPGKRCKKD